jgi:predicted ATP-grasp superfamily ATP-dependent carboligase
MGYFRFLEARLRAERYDVLLPTHDQAFLLSRFRDRLSPLVGVPVPEFAAIERLQSKADFLGTLEELGLPHPPTRMARTRTELEEFRDFPFYLKLSYSTAGRGIWLINNAAQLHDLANHLEAESCLDGGSEVLVQQPALGNLGVVQSVFQYGRLIAAHCYEARALGVGGSARARISASHPLVIEHVSTLGSHLHWHGALMLDYLCDPSTKSPAYIDANPRIGETMNATLSGVNLAEALVSVALDQPLQPLPRPRSGVCTHSVLMSMLAVAQEATPRRRISAEVWQIMAGLGDYGKSEDELTRPKEDFLSIAPAALLAGQLLIAPGRAKQIVRDTVAHYALSESAARMIRSDDAAWR